MKRALCIALCVLSLTESSAALEQPKSVKKRDIEQIQKLNVVYRQLLDKYVDEIALDSLVERAIVGTMSQLDPHSVYLTADEMKAARESLENRFVGIGVRCRMLRDTLIVFGTTDGSPAQKAGIATGDRIVKADGKSLVGLSSAQAVEPLRGKHGSKVRLSIVRRDRSTDRLELTRSDIPIDAVAAAYREGDRTGYVALSHFGRGTTQQLLRAAASLGDIRSLILDLRGNGGGIFEEALGVAGAFLPEGATIVATSGRSSDKKTYTAPRRGALADMPLVVLIDEESASASEVVAGALQDHDRAVIVGRPSYGKGLVQRQIEFPDGSAIRLTTSRYMTPAGRIIQRPYRNGHRDDYLDAHAVRYTSGDSLSFEGKPRFRTLRHGRTVYGGGGITPDIIVERDTAPVDEAAALLISFGQADRYAVSHAVDRRDSLLALYPAIDDFERGFDIASLPDAALCDLCDENLVRYVIATMAEYLYGSGSGRRIINRRGDEAYRIAAETAASTGRIRRILCGEME